MRLKLVVLVGTMTVLALAGGGSAAMASDGGGPTHNTSPDPGEAVASIGIASDGPLTQADAEKLAKCMRANGIPDFETPKVTEPSGDEPGRIEARLPKDVDPETARKATEKCTPGAPEKARISPSELKKLEQYAQCIRDTGIENFPSPSADGSLRLTEGIDPDSDEFKAAEEACEKYAPARRIMRSERSGGPGEPVLHTAA